MYASAFGVGSIPAFANMETKIKIITKEYGSLTQNVIVDELTGKELRIIERRHLDGTIIGTFLEDEEGNVYESINM